MPILRVLLAHPSDVLGAFVLGLALGRALGRRSKRYDRSSVLSQGEPLLAIEAVPHREASKGKARASKTAHGTSKVHISEQEAQDFLVELQKAEKGGSGWQNMMRKDVPLQYQYTAARLLRPGEPTLYLTITTVPDVTPMELMEFWLDDESRRNWEGFLQEATVLETGDWQRHREQVVRWMRTFPLNFLSGREYVIARKAWALLPDPHKEAHEGQQQQAPPASKPKLLPLTLAKPESLLVAVTRGMDEHSGAPPVPGLVRTSQFNSRWLCRAVPNPWVAIDGSKRGKGAAAGAAAGGAEGPSKTAAQVVLLHSENIHVPESLAKTAVSLGMSNMVKQLVKGLQDFVQARRARLAAAQAPAHLPDARAFGWEAAAAAAAAQDLALAPSSFAAKRQDSQGTRSGKLTDDLQAQPSGGVAASGSPTLVTPDMTPRQRLAPADEEEEASALGGGGTTPVDGSPRKKQLQGKGDKHPVVPPALVKARAGGAPEWLRSKPLLDGSFIGQAPRLALPWVLVVALAAALIVALFAIVMFGQQLQGLQGGDGASSSSGVPGLGAAVKKVWAQALPWHG